MKMKAGQASFHHCLTFHGSYENRSERVRRCVISHFLNGHSRYVEAKDAHGKGKGHEVTVDDGEVINSAVKLGSSFLTIRGRGDGLC